MRWNWTLIALSSITVAGLAQAQDRRTRTIGALTTDAARLEVSVPEGGVIVIHGATLLQSLGCVSDPTFVRNWVREAAQLLDTTGTATARAPERGGAELRTRECTLQLQRGTGPSASATYALQLWRSRDDIRIATTLTLGDATRFVSLLSASADTSESMTPPRQPSIIGDDAPSGDSPYYEFQVQQQAWPLKNNPAPRYPPELRDARIEGEVLARFVVDTAGRPERSTFKAIKSTNELFTTAVWSLLPDMRFSPAKIGGRKVRQVVQMPFQFKLSP